MDKKQVTSDQVNAVVSKVLEGRESKMWKTMEEIEVMDLEYKNILDDVLQEELGIDMNKSVLILFEQLEESLINEQYPNAETFDNMNMLNYYSTVR